MKTGKKRLTGTLLALCAALLVLCSVLAIGWSKAAKTDAALPEVRNNGTAIQWKYSDEADWRDLVALTELRGAAGENGKNGIDGKDGKNGADGKSGINGINGKDGINGVDGKDGANGKDGKDGVNGTNGLDGISGKDGMNAKSIEVQRVATHIQWRYEGGEWQNLVAIADITGPTGQNGKDGANGKTPEFRVNESTLQWRYVGDEIWLNLYDLSVLKGLDGRDGADGKDGINGKDGIDGRDGADGKDGINGKNGADGKDGADGNTPFIGENGNWWIGTTDTGVKAAGVDGEKGDKGDKGDPGEKGDKGDKGDAGQDGSSPGWFYGVGVVQSVNLQMESAPLYFQGKMSSGGLVSCDGDTVRLSRGHHYQVSVNGAVYAMSNDDKGFYSVRMTDGYDNQLCRDLTSIKVDKGKKLNETRREQHTLSFNRVYDAKGGDIVLRLALEQAEYATYLLSFRGTITVTALD